MNYLPDGLSLDDLTERELVIIEHFMEEHSVRLSESIKRIEQALTSTNSSAAYITSELELCIPSSLLRKTGWQPEDNLELDVRNNALFISVNKKEWKTPHWLD